ncbi:hypothetical protein C8Q73DRAFT_688238 [Cubamyces lactineus]|nr:hypothetical protein C8Q73DRAFT_688238 [Cubamyces lactineus]
MTCARYTYVRIVSTCAGARASLPVPLASECLRRAGRGRRYLITHGRPPVAAELLQLDYRCACAYHMPYVPYTVHVRGIADALAQMGDDGRTEDEGGCYCSTRTLQLVAVMLGRRRLAGNQTVRQCRMASRRTSRHPDSRTTGRYEYKNIREPRSPGESGRDCCISSDIDRPRSARVWLFASATNLVRYAGRRAIATLSALELGGVACLRTRRRRRLLASVTLLAEIPPSHLHVRVPTTPTLRGRES